MTPNEFVKQYMQNCQYGNELSLMTAAIAEENGLVVVFGASDDLCEIRGAEDDEIDCFDGGEATIAGTKVKINWGKNNIPWSYETDTPHECFDVYEDGEKYCRGIVFSISDVRLPSADVVEVVRCKDCIFRGREDCAMFYRCNCGEQHTWETDNDFCSYGERDHEKE